MVALCKYTEEEYAGMTRNYRRGMMSEADYDAYCEEYEKSEHKTNVLVTKEEDLDFLVKFLSHK